MSDSGIEAARHYLANRELPKPEVAAGAELDSVPSPVVVKPPEETDDGQHIYFKLDGFQATCPLRENLELAQEDEEDSQEETNLDLGGARNSLVQSQCSCLTTRIIV